MQTTLSSKGGFHIFKKKDIDTMFGKPVTPGQIIYPHEMPPIEFHNEIIDLKKDFFALRVELREVIDVAKKKHKIYDSKLDKWLKDTGKKLNKLSDEVDYIEDNPQIRKGKIFVSKWSLPTIIRDGLAWDVFKGLAGTIRRALIGI